MVPGLRERKKQQTRDRLVAEALRLCEERGFDNTTVEDIAEAADVSPRTFNRYFSTKEDVVLAPADDMIAEVRTALAAQPKTGDEIEALVNSHRQMFGTEGDAAERSARLLRMQQMNRIMQTAPSVNARGREIGERKMAAIGDVVAQRMGLSPDDLRVRVIISTWSTLIHLALERWDCCPDSGNSDTAAAIASLDETYAAFRAISG